MRFIIYIAALLVPLYASAYKYESITVDDGLGNMIVRCTAQDRNRVLWFATNSGIQSFDGTGFRDYHIKDIQGCNSNDNRFSRVLTDGSGNLYAANRSNVFRYLPEGDRFAVVFPGSNAAFPELTINSLDIGPGGILYISTAGGLYVLDPAGGNVPSKPVSAECYGVASRDGIIHAATSRGVVTLEYSPAGMTVRNPGDHGSPREAVTFIFCDSRGNLWTRSTGGVEITDRSGNTVRPEWNSLVENRPVRALAEYDGLYVVAVDGLGLLYCDSRFRFSFLDKPSDDTDNSLTTDGIYHLFRDADNYLWISTFTGGLNYINPNAWGFRHIKHQSNLANSLSNNSVRAIMEDSRSNLWFGNKNGISVLDGRTGNWSHLTNLPSNTVLAFSEDMNGHVWVSAFSAGVVICNKDLKILRTLHTANSGISSNDIFVIFRDSDSDMWLSGEDGVLSLVSMPSMEITRYDIGNVVRSMRQLRSGKIVAAGSAGVHIIDKKSGEVSLLYPGTEESLRVSMTYSIVEDRSGSLWLASEGEGVIKLSPDGRITQQLTMDDGLLSNVVYGLELSDSELWISTNRGLSRYDIFNRSLINFTRASGVGMNGFMYCCHTKLSDGRLIFGGLGGAVLFDPADVYYSNEKRPLIFTQFRIFNQEVTPGADSPLKEAVNVTSRVRLRHNQNAVSIAFSSVMPVSGVYRDYEWILEGLDNVWSQPSRENIATYNNLAPGKYKFRVRTVNYQPNIEPAERELDIIIMNPWWKTLWAYLAYLLVVGVIIVFIAKYLRRVFASKINENKVRLFTGVAHDIKTPLSIIRLLLANIRTRLDGADADTERDLALAIDHSNRLTELANQLLEVEKATSTAIPVRVAKYRIEASIEGISFAFSSILERKNIDLLFDFPETPTWAWFDMGMFQKVIYNLLDNAVKYTPDGGRITVATRIESAGCRITISDTGIGIPETEKKNILRHYFRATNAVNSSEGGSGVGLLLVRELVRNMGGSISFTSLEGAGTAFTILVPLGRGHLRPSDTVVESSVKPVLPPAGSYHVMIVEDNIELRNLICSHLEPVYKVSAAGDGEEALQMIEQTRPDVIITDYMMPKLNGIGLCRELKSRPGLCRIPVIMLTALSSNEHKVEGFNAGVDAYVEKPFDMNVVMSLIGNMIHNRSLSGAAEESPGLPDTPDSRLLRIFESHVLEYLSDTDFSVEDICAQIGIGYTSFYRKIKAVTGKSPIDLITDIRLRKADEYLATGEYNVAQVGYMTGFSSPSYFTKVYKKRFGYPPTKKKTKT